MGLDPFFDSNPLVRTLAGDRGRVEQTRENSARHAICYTQVATLGMGEVLVETVLPFDCTFVEQPRVAYGFSLDGDLLVDGNFPSSSGGVWKWQQDHREYYLGAYVYFVISGGDGNLDLIHDFTFTGIAIKDLPEHLLED